VGLALGWLVSRLLRTPPEFRVHALVAIAFGNVGNLPLGGWAGGWGAEGD
jgi:predicted permease